jgi:hypothetical protein
MEAEVERKRTGKFDARQRWAVHTTTQPLKPQEKPYTQNTED